MSESLETALIENYGQENLPVLQELKQEAKSAFIKNGLPKFKEEEYKFTPIAKALEKNFTFNNLPKKGIVSESDIKDYIIEDKDSIKLVFINGVFSKELSVIKEVSGLVIKDLQTATIENKDTVLKYFSKLKDEDAFTSLNTALTEDGCFIEVERNAIIETPIFLYFVNTSNEAESFSFPRNLFIANQSSNIKLIEKTITLGNHNSFTNSMTEVFMEENAVFHQIKLQNDVNHSYEVNQTKVHQKGNSNYSAYTISLSGALIRNNLNIISDGENCESNMYGLYLLNGKTHVDNHTSIDHKQPNSYSNELYKGVMDERSRGVFNGKIFVRQEAQKTNAFQSNNNILLSDNATINTKPQLEIWADDVKCSHGCTSGQLNEEAIFYLQTRGISKEKAIGMLLFAFANDVVNKIPIDSVKEYLSKIVENRLNS